MVTVGPLSKRFLNNLQHNTFSARYNRSFFRKEQLEGDWKRLNLSCSAGETYVRGQNKAWISPLLLFCWCSAAHVASMWLQREGSQEVPSTGIQLSSSKNGTMVRQRVSFQSSVCKPWERVEGTWKTWYMRVNRTLPSNGKGQCWESLPQRLNL